MHWANCWHWKYFECSKNLFKKTKNVHFRPKCHRWKKLEKQTFIQHRNCLQQSQWKNNIYGGYKKNHFDTRKKLHLIPTLHAHKTCFFLPPGCAFSGANECFCQPLQIMGGYISPEQFLERHWVINTSTAKRARWKLSFLLSVVSDVYFEIKKHGFKNIYSTKSYK